MNLFVFVLLLIQSISSYGFRLQDAGDCEDFTVGDCTLPDETGIIMQFACAPESIQDTCQEVCRSLSDCILWSHDGTTCTLLNKEYRKGCGTVGAPVDADMDMCEDAIVESCSGFDEENCEYFGESIGVDPPDGQISDPLVCQQMCKTFSGLGCTFWVYRDKQQSCQLLRSSDRICTGISGPKAPPMDQCRAPKSCPFGTEFGGTCYEFVDTPATWDAASKDCSGRGGALASVLNQEVNDYLVPLAKQRTWIGGNDIDEEGHWVWSSGEALEDYTNWHSGEPNNLGNNEDCLELGFYTGGEWNDYQCSSAFQYICKFSMTVV